MGCLPVMRYGWSLALSLIVGCNAKVDMPPTQAGSGGQGQSATNACQGKPVPTHECVGGVPSPRCNVVDGEARWQIDCVPPDPNAPPDLRGVSPCAVEKCGDEPAWDAKGCLYGFAGTKASCESIDRGACTWRRRCLPKPCSVAEGTCNVLHRDRLGAPCSASVPCSSGSSCASISVNIGEYVEPVCVAAPPCSALTCANGKTCVVMESYPAQIACTPM